MEALLELCTRPAVFLREAWWTLPLRPIVGYGFMEHGVAKLERGREVFAGILHALHMAAVHLLAYLACLAALVPGGGGPFALDSILLRPFPNESQQRRSP